MEYTKTVVRNNWIPRNPHPRQKQFLVLADVLEVLFGGAAGGGKSEAVLMAAAQYLHVPGYSALLLRESFTDLMQPKALIPRSKEWWMQTDASWDGQGHRWTFPCEGGGFSTIGFGYLDRDDSVYQYQSAEFQFIGVDELTQHSEFRYRYMFSRLRKPKIGPLGSVPLRMRAGTNPGGKGHDWVKGRFIEPQTRQSGSVFVPSKLEDNPTLDADEYRMSLSHLDPVSREQLLAGDWDIVEGNLFQRPWFVLSKEPPAAKSTGQFCRYWDKAGTSGGGDYSAGVLMQRDKEGTFWVIDVIRGQWNYGQRERMIEQTAMLDRQRYGHVKIQIEQEPGSGGKESAERTVKMLAGFPVSAATVTGDKSVRASGLASQAFADNVRVLIRPWTQAFLDEMCVFPAGQHDDMVDAAAGAFNVLSGVPNVDLSNIRTSADAGRKSILDDLPEGVFG